MTHTEALELIVANQDANALNWAVNYAKVALVMVKHGMEPEEIAHQLLYVRSNLSHWRHPQAKDVRLALDKYIKEAR